MVSTSHNLSESSPQNLSGSATVSLDFPTAPRPLSFTLKVSHLVTPDDVFSSSFSKAGFSGLDIRQLASEGYFQAIAYLLNQNLVPQNIYAQVSRGKVAGRLKILVEYERAPQPQRLIRFICDRIYILDSDLIEGVHLVARIIGSAKTDWEERIRIPTISQRHPSSKLSIDSSDANSTDAGDLDTDSSDIDSSSTNNPETGSLENLKLLHESARSKIARQVIRSQFKFFRAALLSGTATAAFIFGGLTDLILSERLSTAAVQPESAIAPWYEASSEASEVTFAPEPSRFTGRTVEAALETVSVIPHRAGDSPQDPTVTLLFGGELGLNDFVFEDADSLDQLFSELGIYRRADIAMLGLSEPLATPSTSLQENFYHRTRPEAVQALKAGGIDIVSLASEGTLTYGVQGLEETLKTLDQEGIYRVGAGRNQQEAHRPEILEVKNQRIAYLGYNPEALKAARGDTAGVASAISEERQHILEDIQAIRPQVDWIVVNYRWGDLLKTSENISEDTPKDTPKDTLKGTSANRVPAEWQRSLAHDAIDAGADLVVGYHPSQIQGAEIYRDRAIAYSLGDFVFGKAPLEDHDTVALRVSLRNRQMKVEFLPVSIRNSRLQMATGDHGSAILQNIRRASQSFDQPMQFPAVLKARSADLPPLPAVLAPAQSYPVPLDLRSVQPLPVTSPAPFTEPVSPPFVETSVEPALTLDASGREAQNPLLRESDALFQPEAENEETTTN
ncbi:MAG: CapA family protein [Phormidesmis sp.]